MTPNEKRARTFRPRFYRGFTIVEMLLVIGVIMLLLAIMLPSLSAVQTRSRKMTELNNLRQVGMAWSMYSTQHNDGLLPGFLTGNEDTPQRCVQTRWRVRYEFPAVPRDAMGNPVTMDPAIPKEIAQPWTWRLAEYFDYSPEIIWGYNPDSMNELQAMVDSAKQVALEPAFGYNAYHVGGWWLMVAGTPADGDFEPGLPRPRFSFWDATRDGQSVNYVVRTMSTMKQPENLIIFCSSTRLEHEGLYGRFLDDVTGSHVVMPPTMGEDTRWRVPGVRGAGGDGMLARATGDRNAIEVMESPAHVPTARHNQFAALLHGDGATATETMSALNDMRKWIDGLTSIDDRYFTYEGTYWEYDSP